MKSVDQKWNKTVNLCFVIGLIVRGLKSSSYFFVFQLFKKKEGGCGGGSISMHAQSSPLGPSGGRRIKGMWMT